jgi:uncharacterized membrane protein
MNLNSAHIHLLLNHLPIIGTLFGLLLLSAALLRKSDELKRTGLVTFILTALITIPVYLSGDPTAGIVEKLPGVSLALIERHDNAATISFAAVAILGIVALFGLWRYRRTASLPNTFVMAVLAMSVIVSSLMIWTGSLGGQIRHTEVRADFVAPASSVGPSEIH